MRAIIIIIMFLKKDAHRHGGREGSREATDEKTYRLNNIILNNVYFTVNSFVFSQLNNNQLQL